MYQEMALFPRTMVGTVAVGQALGLAGNDMYWFVYYRHGYEYSMTAAYNERIIGGRRPRIAGWVLTAIGAVALAAGGIYAAACNGSECLEDDKSKTKSPEDQDKNDVAPWAALLITGGVFAAAGIPCLAVGYGRTKHWLPEGHLEREHVSKYRKAPGFVTAPSPGPSVAIAPYLGPGQGGIGLMLTF